MQIGSERYILQCPITERFQKSSPIPVGRESVRIFMPLFWRWPSTKNIYKNNEST